LKITLAQALATDFEVLPIGTPLASTAPQKTPAVDRSGDAHAMLQLANVQPSSRLDNAGLGHPVFAMAHSSGGDERLSNQGA